MLKVVGASYPVPLRPGDDVQVTTTVERGRFRWVRLEYGSRQGSSHCLVALPMLSLSQLAQGAPTWLRFKASYFEGLSPSASLPFVVFATYCDEQAPIHEERLRFFAGESADICLRLSPPEGAHQVQLTIYADRRRRGILSLGDVHAVSGSRLRYVGVGDATDKQVDRTKSWSQESNKLICTSFFGEHYAVMPDGWRLESVHPGALAAAEWFLFDRLEAQFFGGAPSSQVRTEAQARPLGRRTLLSFSLGTDSVAAATLLPPSALSYYCERDYDSYTLSNGAVTQLASQSIYREGLAASGDVIRVPNTFEKIGVAAGKRHGYDHGYGYAAIGLLLADHFDAGDLAFGSVMEQVFLRSGYVYSDVVGNKSSLYNGVRAALILGGLRMTLPTAGCSEVITSRLAEVGRYAGLAISCPRPDIHGRPCGTCFKCFRKLRIFGAPNLPVPDEGVLRLLSAHPLKSATSVVYACQRSGDFPPGVERYRDVNLGFLERYYSHAVDEMIPDHLRAYAKEQLAAFKIRPMTQSDVMRLQSIGEVFL